MIYASVCDGIGAAHQAWHSLGWRCAWPSPTSPTGWGMVRAFTVNQDGEAFDGAGIAPGFVCVHVDAITPAPIERSVEPVQLWYGGKPLNRVPRAGRKE